MSLFLRCTSIIATCAFPFFLSGCPEKRTVPVPTSQPHSSQHPTRWGLPSMGQPWKLLSSRQRKKHAWTLQRWHLQSNSAHAFVRRYAPWTMKQALRYKKTKNFLLQSLFDERDSPYAGVLSNRQKCPPSLRPRKELSRLRQGWRQWIAALANERFVPGTCSRSLNRYQSRIVTLYCAQKKTLLHLELFVPLSRKGFSWSDWKQSLHCKHPLMLTSR